MARSDAYITVTCDRCKQATAKVELLAIDCGWDESIVWPQLCSLGWHVDGGEDICPRCVEAKEKEEES
jgi:phage FluMu protein Com